MNGLFVTLLVLGLIGLTVGVVAIIVENYIENTQYIKWTTIGFTTFVITIVISIVYMVTYINPIEVYRGNTTLEITYKDGVPIDSVVVYKNI